jgi:pyruvate/2-oxoglutarate/acetoin dehydrogenase E1 component
MKFVHSLNQALEEILNQNQKVVLYGEDLIDPYGGAFKVTKGLSTKFPDRVLSTPISEASIIGMAGGMAIGGLLPVVEIMFGDFLMLGADQILNHLVKYKWMYNDQVKVPVTIRTSMGGGRGYGPTHSQSIEPILASIPGIKIISPTYYHDPGSLLKHTILKDDGIKIFSEYKMNYSKDLINESNVIVGLSIKYSHEDYPTLYLSNSDFEDPEVMIISHGGNCALVEKVLYELLIEDEINVQANFPSLIKPLVSTNELFYGIEKTKTILILEESPKEFGWGSEVISLLVKNNLIKDKKVIQIGMKEHPIPSSALLEKNVLPSVTKTINKIKGSLE